jgi:hypothetical protein
MHPGQHLKKLKLRVKQKERARLSLKHSILGLSTRITEIEKGVDSWRERALSESRLGKPAQSELLVEVKGLQTQAEFLKQDCDREAKRAARLEQVNRELEAQVRELQTKVTLLEGTQSNQNVALALEVERLRS